MREKSEFATLLDENDAALADWLRMRRAVGITDQTSGHDSEKDGKFCDNRQIGMDCMRPGRRCGTCPERSQS